MNVSTASGLATSARARSLVRYPILALDKVATLEAGPGETVVYTITVRNSGQSVAYNVEVSDLIPSYIVAAFGDGESEMRANEVHWYFAALQPDESRILSWRGQIEASIPDSISEIINQVTVQDAAGNADEAEATTNLHLQRIDLTKTGTYEIHPGSDVAYTITVRNPGNTRLYDIVVTDPLPEYVLNARNIGGGGELRGNTEVVWEIPSLAAGQELELTWIGTVDTSIPDKQTSLTNEATLFTGSDLEAKATAKSLVYHPVLTIDKIATLEAGPGDVVSYTLTIENPSQAPAYEVEINDPIPAQLGQAAVSPGGVIQADEIYWRFDTLQPGQTVTMTWSGVVDEWLSDSVAEIVNKATVQDATGQVEVDEAVTDLLAQRLNVTKGASYLIEPGGSVVYTITLHNSGRATLYNLVVTDPLPEYILNPQNISGSGELHGNTEIGWEIPVLTAGQEINLTWVGILDTSIPEDEIELYNEINIVTGSGLEAEAKARSRILRPTFLMAKQAPSAVGPGDCITYTIFIENVGQVAAHDVVIHDPIPPHVLNVGNINNGGHIDYLPGHEVQWQLGDLQLGERQILTWAGTVNPRIELEPGATTTIDNIATAQDGSGTTSSAAVETMVLQPQQFPLWGRLALCYITQ